MERCLWQLPLDGPDRFVAQRQLTRSSMADLLGSIDLDLELSQCSLQGQLACEMKRMADECIFLGFVLLVAYSLQCHLHA